MVLRFGGEGKEGGTGLGGDLFWRKSKTGVGEGGIEREGREGQGGRLVSGCLGGWVLELDGVRRMQMGNCSADEG